MVRACAWLAIAVGVSAGAIARQDDPAGPRLTEVYQAGDAGYHTFRIPSLIAARNGTLLAFAEARREGAADAGDIDLVVKRSRDGGRTWSPAQVVGDNGPNTFGNPCPVLDRTTGTIWLLTTQNRGLDRERDIIAGTSQGTRTVWVLKSTDDGETWSAPVDITTSVKRAGWTWYATGPGVGIQTKGGRLVIPANHAEAGHRSPPIAHRLQRRRRRALDARRERRRRHQREPDRRARRRPAAAEHAQPSAEARELPHGRHQRATAAARCPTTTADRALIEPPAQASLIAVRDEAAADRRRLIFANPASTRRERLTVRVSEDGGVTWPVARVVHEGPAAYSSLAALADGAIGLLFERGDRTPYERITFARLTRQWLAASQASGSPTIP